MKGAPVLLLLAGCVSQHDDVIGGPFYFDKPETGWYWVPKGTDWSSVIASATKCGAKIEGSVANHGIVPPGFDYGVFKFVEPVTDAHRLCTIANASAVPELTIYEKKR